MSEHAGLRGWRRGAERVMAPIRCDRLEEILDRFGGLRLLVVGDVVLDEFVMGDVERVSPEAPVPVVHVREEAVALGGAANVARNIATLGGCADVISVVGDDDAGECIADLMAGLGLDPSHLTVSNDRPLVWASRSGVQKQR